jgi:hypothetical protein
MDAEFLRGLILFTLICASPLIMAWLWRKHQDRKYRKYRVAWENTMTNLSIQMSEGYRKGYADELARQRQVRKDDHIFNTVEEYRHDVG